MAGYLDTYGVAEARRGKYVKRIILTVIALAIVGTAGWLYFRNFSERRVAGRFLDAVKAKDFNRAYQIWGCTPTTPCRDYSFNKFMEDWGPSGVYARATEGEYTIEDICGVGVVFTLEIPGAEPLGIYVNRADKSMSFAPWPRCPGRHLHLWEFIKKQFG